jgi:tol-pal system protein YbgF
MIKHRIFPTTLALVFSASVSTFAVAEDVPVIELGADSENRSSMNIQAGQAPRGGELAMIIQQLQDEVRTLRGQLEQQSYQLKQMERQQLDRYRDLDRRISTLSGAATQNATSSLPVAPKATTATDKPATPASVEPNTVSNDAEVYRNAFTLVRERKFDQAENAFADFIKQYPQSPRLPNAFYWLGEVRLAQQKTELARESFTQVVTAYSDHRKAPDAAYKLGIVYDQLGDKQKSQEYLDLVIQKYPQSSAVRLAKEFKRLQ